MATCKPTIVRTVLRDGIRKAIGSKQARKYTKAEAVNHDIIYDFLATLADTTSQNTQKTRLNVAVNSDKSTIEVAEVAPLKFEGGHRYFSQQRFELLLGNYIDRKRQHAKRLQENILRDYSEAFGIEFQSLQQINEVLSTNNVPNYTPDQVAKMFSDKGLPFILDYHYTVGVYEYKDEFGNDKKKKFPELKPSIVKYIQETYSADEAQQALLNQRNAQAVRNSIIEQREEILKKEMLNGNDFNIYYAVAKMKEDGQSDLIFTEGATRQLELTPAERQAIRRKVNASDEKVLNTLRTMKAYDDKDDKIAEKLTVGDPAKILPPIIDEFLISWMNASEEYHTASIGSTLFFKGNNEQKQYIERGKRGALLSSTIHPYDTSNPFGIPREGQLVVVEDPKQDFQTLVREMGLDIADGSSFSTEVQQIQFKNSLGNQIGQPTGSHIKDLGVFKDVQRETATFKKDNNFLISHERIRKSEGNDLDFRVINDSLYRQSSLKGLFERVDVPERTFNSRYKNEAGEIVSVQLKYVGQDQGFPVFSVSLNGQKPTNVRMETLLDLYNALGNAYSVNDNNEYTKINERGHSPNVINDILSLDVLLKTFKGQSHDEASKLKSKMKLGFSFVSAIKSSQPNINKLSDLKAGKDLMSATVDQSHLGIQLNASKDTDDKEATLPSQIIGALGLTSYTPEYTTAAFEALKEVVVSSIDERLNAENVQEDPSKLIALYDAIRELSIEGLSTTGTAGLASYILAKANVPLDNPQVSKIVTAAVNAYLSSEGIRKNIFGNQYVLAPPIQVYEDAQSTYFGDERQRRQPRVFENRLSESGILDETILKEPRTVFYKVIQFQQEGKPSFTLSGKEALKFQLDTKTPYLFKTQNQEQVEAELQKAGIQYKKVGDALSLSFELIEDMDAALSILGDDIEIDYDNTTARDLKPARVKYVLQEGGQLTVRDLYSTQESKLLRSGKKITTEVRNQTLNDLDNTIQRWNKNALYVLSSPGEIIAPKSWKSKFLLSDQDDLSKMKGDDNYLSFFENQVETNEARQKALDDLYLKDENGEPLYKVLGIVPNTEANSQLIQQIDTLTKTIKDSKQKVKDSRDFIRRQEKLLETATNSTTIDKINRAVNTEKKSIASEQALIDKLTKEVRSKLGPAYASRIAENFQEALKSVTTRIPLQSLASVMSQEIVGFLDTEENTAMVNNEHQGLTGGDFDVDKTTYMSRYVNRYGLIESRKSQKEYWINKLFEQIYNAAIDDRNMIQRESGVDMDGVDEVVKSRQAYQFKENHYLSAVELKNANMVGKDVIGVAATMIKVYAAMNVATNKKLDEFVKLYDDLLKQTNPLQADVDRLQKLYQELHQEFNYSVGGKKTKVHFLSNLPTDKVLRLYQYMEAGLEPLDDNAKIKMKEYEAALRRQHKTADVLGQLLNAATDNAKHLYLGRMKVDVDTAGLLATMVIDGIPLAAAVDFLLDPALSDILEQKNSNLFKGDPGLSIRKAVKIKYQEFDELYRIIKNPQFNLKEKLQDVIELGYQEDLTLQENVERAAQLSDQYYSLLGAVDKSAELTALGQILGINQGLKPTSFGMYARVNNVNQFYQGKVQFALSDISRDLKYERITEQEAKERVDKLVEQGLVKLKDGVTDPNFKLFNYEPADFDFIRWIEDEQYRNSTTELYGKLKTAHNIFDTLQNLPHTLEQLKIFAKSYRILEATSPKFNAAIATSKQINKLRLINKPFNEQMFENYVRAMNMYTQDSYFNSAEAGVHKVTVGGVDYDLKTQAQREAFVKALNSHMIDLKKERVDNEFLKMLVLDESRLNEHGQSIQRLKTIFSKDVISPTSSELAQELAIKADMRKLGPEMIKALRYYNLLIYQDSNTKGSFTSLFTNPEAFDGYWNFESSVTTQQLVEAFNFSKNPRIAVYYLTKAGVYEIRAMKEEDKSQTRDDDDFYGQQAQYQEDSYQDDYDYQDYIDDYQSQAYVPKTPEERAKAKEKYKEKMNPIPIRVAYRINGDLDILYKIAGQDNPTTHTYGRGYLADGSAVVPTSDETKIKPVEVDKVEEVTYRKKVQETYNKKAVSVIENLLNRVIEIGKC